MSTLRPSIDPRTARLVPTLVAASLGMIASVALPAAPAVAQQSNRNTMIMSDGEQQRVLHFARPDLGPALQPEYVPADVRVLARELALTDDQREVASIFLREYLDAFEALKESQYEDLLRQADPDRPARPDAPGRGPGRRPGQGGQAGGGEPGPDSPPVAEHDTRDAVRGIMLEELRNAGFKIDSMDEFPYQPEVAVGVSMSPTGDGSPPEPVFNVNVSFGADDDSLAGDVREKLQAAADRMVPRITEHTRKQFQARMAEQSSPMEDAAGQLDRAWDENERVRSRVNELLARRAQLRAQLEEQLRAVLDDQQLERWPQFERVFTRLKTLPWGVLDGERTDLAALLEALPDKDAASDSIAETLAEYESRLHDLLVRRNELLETADQEIDHALHEGETRKAMTLARRLARARVAVRELNHEFTGHLAAELPAEHGGAFRKEAQEASFPRVYRQTIGAQAFAKAAARPDLTPERREMIDAMREVYESELNVLNDRLRTLIHRVQAEQLTFEIERVASLIENGALPDADDSAVKIAEEFQRRVDLDRRHMRSLYAGLTDAERAGLPRIPGEDATEPVRSEHREGGGDQGGG